MFLDTNVLIYATRPSSGFHPGVMAALEKALREEPCLAINLQVLREYLAVVTRPGGRSEPLTLAAALDDILRFSKSFKILEDGRRRRAGCHSGRRATRVLPILANQTEVTVKGVHFVQEDSPDEIGRALKAWYQDLP